MELGRLAHVALLGRQLLLHALLLKFVIVAPAEGLSIRPAVAALNHHS